MREFLAGLALAGAVALCAVGRWPYSEPLPHGAHVAMRHPHPASAYDPNFWLGRMVVTGRRKARSEAPVTVDLPLPPVRPRVTVTERILAEASKSVGKGPRELGLRLDLWCADFINKTLRKIGERGTGSDLASSFAHWGKPAKPGPGVVAVKPRRGGNHVVIIKAIHGSRVIAISGNARGKVRLMEYSLRQFYAFRAPA